MEGRCNFNDGISETEARIGGDEPLTYGYPATTAYQKI